MWSHAEIIPDWQSLSINYVGLNNPINVLDSNGKVNELQMQRFVKELMSVFELARAGLEGVDAVAKLRAAITTRPLIFNQGGN